MNFFPKDFSKMSFEPSIPVPLDPLPQTEADGKRLWIGNIDNRLTEYCLLKIVQEFGKIKRFDFLFHKSGALQGRPRGYSFVTYETREQAEKALITLNGKTVLGKDLSVKWAHKAPTDSGTKSKPLTIEKPLEGSKESKSPTQQIKAIEQKLKAMKEQPEKELELCLSAVSSGEEDFNPIIKTYTSTNQRKERCEPYRRTRKQFGSCKR